MVNQMEFDINECLLEGKELTPFQRTYIARHPERPGATDYINNLFTDFVELAGDRLMREDASILGGIAMFHGVPVTVIAQKKGKNLTENLAANFGMVSPEGFRKAMRLMKQAEKFNRPVITFVDTPGAYPGISAEEHGQGEAIARSMALMSDLEVPIISVITGEGNSGGALALLVADKIMMLENSIFSILSPEGFASILWKDAKRKEEACELMRLTADNLYEDGFIDKVIKEPKQGAHKNPESVFKKLDDAIWSELKLLMEKKTGTLVKERYNKFRNITRNYENC